MNDKKNDFSFAFSLLKSYGIWNSWDIIHILGRKQLYRQKLNIPLEILFLIEEFILLDKLDTYLDKRIETRKDYSKLREGKTIIRRSNQPFPITVYYYRWIRNFNIRFETEVRDYCLFYDIRTILFLNKILLFSEREHSIKFDKFLHLRKLDKDKRDFFQEKVILFTKETYDEENVNVLRMYTRGMISKKSRIDATDIERYFLGKTLKHYVKKQENIVVFVDRNIYELCFFYNKINADIENIWEEWEKTKELTNFLELLDTQDNLNDHEIQILRVDNQELIHNIENKEKQQERVEKSFNKRLNEYKKNCLLGGFCVIFVLFVLFLLNTLFRKRKKNK